MAKSHLKRVSANDSNAGPETEATCEPNASVKALNLTQPALSEGELGSLQKIMFGKQMAIQSSQLSSLYHHVETRLAKLQHSCEQQFADLHVKLDERLSHINVQVQNNDKKHVTGIADVNNSLDAAESRLQDRLKQAAANNSKVHGQLKSQLTKSSEQLSTSIKTSHDEIMQRLDTAIAELNSQKLDKGALSTLLGDVAVQLTGHENK